MKTAVDSSVLLDVLLADPRFGEESRQALKRAYDGGALLASDVVWAEVRAHFPSERGFQEAIGVLGVRFDPISASAAAEAGRFWRESRKSSRSPRSRVVADFLIGAHAQLQADAFLTRDQGFYRKYFQGLSLIEPRRA